MNILESSISHDDRQVVIDEIDHQKALILELRDIVQPILPKTQDGLTKTVLQLFGDIFSSSSKAISLLELSGNREKNGDPVQGKRKCGKHSMENHNNLGEEARVAGNKRRKNKQTTGSVVTQEPHSDGYQWRKYGQKWISKARHSRSYYRCANSKVQGCPATKTVQQMETDGSKLVRMFNVDYYGEHICKRDDIVHPYVDETDHHSASPTNHNQCNSAMLVDEVHQVQEGSFENLFMVHDMLECLTDIEMSRAVEATMNFPLHSEPLLFGNSLRCEQQSPLYIWPYGDGL